MPLGRDAARALGIGNSTGLGMAPFLINHPGLLHNWIAARETAIARVRARKEATAEEAALFRAALGGARRTVDHWHTDSPLLTDRIAGLGRDLARIADAARDLSGPSPWDRLCRFADASLGTEAQECLASLILEPYPALVDDLCKRMADDAPAYRPIDGRMRAGEMRAMIEARYGWALGIDWGAPEALARVWYVSEEKLEPRLGERATEPLDAYEEPLAPGRDVARLFAALGKVAPATPLADVLREQPDLRHAARRVQATEGKDYAEIRDNTIGAALLPIDMLRAKLSFFGATGFDPRSDRWVRICMFAGAPYPDEIDRGNADLWVYPGLVEGRA